MDRNKFELALYSYGIFISVIVIAFLTISRLSSGKVKLHIISPQYKYLRTVFIVVWVTAGIVILIYAKTLIDFVEGFFWLGLGIAYFFLIKSGADIREKGILYIGGFISWEGIESFGWEKHENTHKLIITRKKPFLGFSKEVIFKVPAEKFENTDILLNHYLHGKALV